MTARFDVLTTPLPGLQVLQRKPIGDSRGHLQRMYCIAELDPVLHGKHVVQINHTLTKNAGTIRGMHFQRPPHSEIKLISCLRGEVFDVAVDLREGSATFLHWHAELLSSGNHRTMVVPEGFAHGFQALTDDCELLYLHTAMFRPEAEAGLNALDPRLSITWPLPAEALSARDQGHPMLTNGFRGIKL